jgi:hypothetical protein
MKRLRDVLGTSGSVHGRIRDLVASLSEEDRERCRPQVGGQWIPMPSTYLNQERWEDQPMEQPTGKAQTVRNLAVVAKWASR